MLDVFYADFDANGNYVSAVFHQKTRKPCKPKVYKAFLLSWKDSNPHKQNQNLRCYHYTTRQWFCAANIEIFIMRRAILTEFYFFVETINLRRYK